MLEPISLALATPIARIILDKLYEGIGTKLGEKSVEAISQPIQKLGQTVWSHCFKGKPGTDRLLEAAARDSQPELNQVRDYLLKEMEKPEFVKMVEPIAQEIYQILRFDNARNVQQVLGGQGLQVNDPKSQVIQTGDNANFYFGATEV